jgi:hypothetical protein
MLMPEYVQPEEDYISNFATFGAMLSIDLLSLFIST